MSVEVRLPELGENITGGDVLRVLVAAGDAVTRDQPILELETDKATLEVPSSAEGRVTDLRVKAGDKVAVGQVILVVDGSAGAGATPSAARETSVAAPVPQKTAAGPVAVSPVASPDVDPPVAESASRSRRGEVVDITSVPRPVSERPARPASSAPAAPSVRRLARELGVDVALVSGSGAGGRITIEDVKAHAKTIIASGTGAVSVIPAMPVPLPDFTKWGEIERRPMSGIRRKTAQHLSEAWATIPHVTQHERADITNLEELRKRLARRAEEAGGSMTVTAIAVKVVAEALAVFPQFNSSVDMASEEIVLKKYTHIGVAVDTDRGLLVPVIRDVNRKNLIEIAVELTQAAEKARSRKLALQDMEGGSFTISNLGGIGGTLFSPIVNAPEVAILGLSRASVQPVFLNGQFQARLVLPLSLSYDHRVIDGADAIRFVRWIVDALEQPFFLTRLS